MVEVMRTAACDGCHKKEDGKGCSVCTLMGGERSFCSLADNSIGAKIGDSVVIETESRRVLWYAVLVFVVPLLSAAIAYSVAYACQLQAAVQVLFALLGFVGCFLILFFYSRQLQRKQPDVRICEILAPSASINETGERS